MKERIEEILCGKEEDYVYSFFEIHPDMTFDEIEKKIQELHRCGIKTLVFEYSMGLGNGFAGFTQHWFDILRRLLPLLKKYDMKFFIQDAAPFPTGAANGWFKSEPYRKHRKIYLAEGHMDVGGPRKGCCFLAEDFLNDKIYEYIPNPSLEQEDELKYVIAVKKNAKGELISSEVLNLTSNVKDGKLRWDVPEGRYRIFFIFTTRNGGRPEYMNLMDEKSVGTLIQSVYEKHYQAIGKEAGNTWRGFFFDEPEFGNIVHHDFYAKVGKRYMSLPWCDQLEPMLRLVLGNDFPLLLPFLWYGNEDGIAGKVRYEYMNIVTRMVQENYSRKMYQWCQAHGLSYIGHVLEDENSHARLGCGGGHFFRIEKYQHMAGVDVISEQLIPGADSTNEANGCNWVADGEFYHYGLAKLASSNAHINPTMNDQSFCEVLALYGMIAGPKYRKYIFDHMVASGINHFIVMQGSHESNTYFPFGNTLYTPYYIMLYQYVNRLCHLMTGGKRLIRAAILYHAEAEWAGDTMLFQKPAKVLAQNQVDYDIIPSDELLEGSVSEQDSIKTLDIHKAQYRVLIVPGCQRLPRNTISKLSEFNQKGFPVIFIDHFPSDFCDYQYVHSSDADKTGNIFGKTLSLSDLNLWIKNNSMVKDIYTLCDSPSLRYCYIGDDDGQALFLHNQSEFQKIDVQLVLPELWKERKCLYMMDLIHSRIVPFTGELKKDKEGRLVCMLNFDQWESIVLLYIRECSFCTALSDNDGDKGKKTEMVEINGPWRLTFEPFVQTQKIYEPLELTKLENISLISGYEDFSGEITYTAYFTCSDAQKEGFCEKLLILDQVYESAGVWLNGQKIGETFASPYVFEIPQGTMQLNNILEIKVQNSMAYGFKDGFIRSSKYVPLEPSGLCKGVNLVYTRNK